MSARERGKVSPRINYVGMGLEITWGFTADPWVGIVSWKGGLPSIRFEVSPRHFPQNLVPFRVSSIT